tara:strand:- start:12 stop:488 length:477 start_codon:yes stop_codon:yes gene_type:complete
MKPPEPRNVPPWGEEQNRIDINLIAMLLWQSLLTGVAVTVSHLDWYLPDAGPAEMGLQYGLIAFGFLCLAMVLFHVGGIRDSLAMRAEFSQEGRYDKWQRGQQRLAERRMRKDQQMQQMNNPNYYYNQPPTPNQTFGLPNQPTDENDTTKNGDDIDQE